MTNAPTPPVEVTEVLNSHPYPLLAIDVDDLSIIGANQAASELLGTTSNSLRGTRVTEIVSSADRPAAEESVRLLASGAINGYRAFRHIQKADGTDMPKHIWMRLMTTDGYSVGLITIEPEKTGDPWTPLDLNIEMAIVVTDHDWVIEHISSDVEDILGNNPESYEGSPVLGLLQPGDVQRFMAAVGRVSAGRGAATLPVHLHGGNGHWQEVSCLVVAMCRLRLLALDWPSHGPTSPATRWIQRAIGKSHREAWTRWAAWSCADHINR